MTEKNWETRESIIDNFFEIAMMDVSSPHDGAVFFSGPKAKRNATKLAAKSHGEKMTVIDTPALTEFVKHQRHYFGRDAKMTLEEGYTIGDWISERFAEQVSGEVRVYLDGVKPHGTFNRAEVPALLENDKIDRFLVYDSQPSIRDVGPFEEIELNRDDFKSYIERKVECVPDRRIGRNSVSSAKQAAQNLKSEPEVS